MNTVDVLRELKDVSLLLYRKTKEEKYLRMAGVASLLVEIEVEKGVADTDVC